MIDIHCHILPNMDDGSKSPEETAAMIDMLWQQGVTTAVATPHFYAHRESPTEFLKRRQVASSQLPPVKDRHIQVLFGAEVTYFSGIGICRELTPLQLGNSKLLLVEMPFAPWSQRMVSEICQIQENLGLTPVLAHVNRYLGREQFPKYAKQLAQKNVYFQCNAKAFLSLNKRRWALRQLKKGQLHFIGSDCHNVDTRPPQLEQARNLIHKKLGEEFYEGFIAQAEEILFPK